VFLVSTATLSGPEVIGSVRTSSGQQSSASTGEFHLLFVIIIAIMLMI